MADEINEKEYCEKLFQQYEEAATRIALVAEDGKLGKTLHPQHINTEDILKKRNICDELVQKCKPFLTPEQWDEIAEH